MATQNHTTSPTLLQRVRDSSDQGAWQTFTGIYSPLIYGFCRRKGLQESDSSDVVQEVLIRLARRIPEFEYDREKGRFRSWLATIVYREISRFKSSSGGLESIDPGFVMDTHASQEWDDHFYQHLLGVALTRAQSRFETETWDAFESVWIRHELPVDVAARMNRSLDFVYLSKSRVVQRLKLEVALLAEERGV